MRGDRGKDVCSRWLLGKQAGSILRLAGNVGTGSRGTPRPNSA
jgi:hypothetical protein